MAKTATSEPRMTAEASRLEEAREKGVRWRQWGPYLSERQWGTVREDYSEDGNAWDYFSHDQARSRASRRRTSSADFAASVWICPGMFSS